MKTTQILVTSAAGDKISEHPNQAFAKRDTQYPVVEIFPSEQKQTITGIGTSFTQSSAFVLAHLTTEQRAEVMQQIYGSEGANFTLARTHIGACDFCVEGRYSYAEVPDDIKLHNFSIKPDKEGFVPDRYPAIKDPEFGLLAMIKQANAIKSAQGDEQLNIVASAWTAPVWMKDIGTWYLPASQANNGQGTGGTLKPEYQQVYADYLVKFIQTYQDEGISIWALTPVNEPQGNNGQWESMHFSPESQRDFIKHYLGPTLSNSAYCDTKLLIYDQNRDHLKEWADVILNDSESSTYVYGTAVHWYESSFKVGEAVLEAVHNQYPAFDIIHTEGCIDDLGKAAPDGVMDPERFEESGWFNNDDFWWHDNATDWAYTATWAPKAEDHPIYTPVHRYARNIIQSIDHWVSGWIDWNIVLDQRGGPNHVGNYCGAPIMIDTTSQTVYYTPIFYVLKQFSLTIRPDDIVVHTHKQLDNLDDDALYACATINAEKLLSVQLLNTTQSKLRYDLKIRDKVAGITIPANAVQTIRVQL